VGPPGHFFTPPYYTQFDILLKQSLLQAGAPFSLGMHVFVAKHQPQLASCSHASQFDLARHNPY